MHTHAATTLAHMAAQLGQISTWLDKASAFATTKKFDADTLLTARLAPDQFPLMRQIASACDSAKLAGQRLSGKTAPVHLDDQKTFADCKARIADVVAYLGTLTTADVGANPDVKITFPWMPGKYLGAADYLAQFAIPNFHFHLTHAYAILRHNGVDLGKADFLGNLPWRDL